MHAEKALEIIAALRNVRESYNALEKVLSSGGPDFYLRSLDELVEGLFSMAKFKVGDPVVLAHDIDCDDKPGWGGCEHFLKQGASAIIRDVDWRKSGFVYDIEFDNETWIDPHTKKINPVSAKHVFLFRERDLVAASR